MQNEQHHIDQFTRKIVQDADLEQASIDFSALVMEEVELAAQKTSLSYRPLISRKTWLILGFAFAGIVLFVLLNTGSSQAPYQILSQIPLPSIQFNFPPILTYSICSLALFFTTGIPFLKKLTEPSW